LLARFEDRRRRLLRNIERRMIDVGTRLHGSSTRIERWGRNWVRAQRGRLAGAERRMVPSMRAALAARRRRHRELAERLAAMHPRARIADDRARLHELERRLLRAGQDLTSRLRPRLARAAGKLDALSPLSVLARGYALVRDDAGTVIRDAAQVEVGERLRLQLSRGELEVVVEARDDRDGASS
jgi:exodeoxyribonuclease VII large subunit